MKSRTLVAVIVVAIIVASVMIAFRHAHAPVQEQAITPTPIATAQYMCGDNKSIRASFYIGTDIPGTPDHPPVPGGSVALILSDGRSMTLAQTLSADGARYANADESFVFWSKGNGALVLENNQEKSYIGCIVVASDTDERLTQTYADSQNGFSIKLPAGYVIDKNYTYQASPIKKIWGTKFTIPASLAQGTNLSNDSYISVEGIPQTQHCSATLFVDGAHTAITQHEFDRDWSVVALSNAGAGNRYEETVYAIPETNPCMAVRYFVHYGAIGNYPEGTVKEFDKEALLKEFDAIRETLILNQ